MCKQIYHQLLFWCVRVELKVIKQNQLHFLTSSRKLCNSCLDPKMKGKQKEANSSSTHRNFSAKCNIHLIYVITVRWLDKGLCFIAIQIWLIPGKRFRQLPSLLYYIYVTGNKCSQRLHVIPRTVDTYM